MPKAVLLMGLSGSGKGTQALKLEQRGWFVHIESSKVIEEAFAANAGDPVIEHERARKAAGDIVAPELVARWMEKAIRAHAGFDEDIVFSGSPRTVFEAQNQLPLLEELYGRENIFVFHLLVARKEAERRSLARRVCEAQQHPIPPEHEGTTCPLDGSPLKVRPDDSDAAKVVFRQTKFEEQTAPVLHFLAERGHPVIEVPAGEPEEAVFERISQALNSRS